MHRSHEIECCRSDQTPAATPHETAKRSVAPVDAGREDREQDERQEKVVQQLQRKLHAFARPVINHAVFDPLTVALPDVGQRIVTAGQGRRRRRHDQPVAILQLEATHARCGDVNAVHSGIVTVPHVSVSVRRDGERAGSRDLLRLSERRALRPFVPLIHGQEQQVGEIDHQADGRRDEQVQNRIRISGTDIHRLSAHSYHEAYMR